MSQYDSQKVEEYQMILLKNPRSPVFAALSEAYRNMGLLEEALELTQKGIKHNPDFASGLVAHARILYELKDYRQAILILNKVRALKPENLLALSLISQCFLKLKQFDEALKSYKKLLILKPNDTAALTYIEKWEFLESSPNEENKNFYQLENAKGWVQKLPSEQKATHIIDSFINAQDNESAFEILNFALLKWPQSHDLKQRQKLLISMKEEGDLKEKPRNRALDEVLFKKNFYEKWLQRVGQSKTVDPLKEP